MNIKEVGIARVIYENLCRIDIGYLCVCGGGIEKIIEDASSES